MKDVFSRLFQPTEISREYSLAIGHRRMRAVICPTSEKEIPDVASYMIMPGQKIWLGFYDEPLKDEKAGFALFVENIGPDAQTNAPRYIAYLWNPFDIQYDADTGYGHAVIPTDKFKEDLQMATGNLMFPHKMKNWQGKQQASGPYDVAEMNAFLRVCQAYGWGLKMATTPVPPAQQKRTGEEIFGRLFDAVGSFNLTSKAEFPIPPEWKLQAR